MRKRRESEQCSRAVELLPRAPRSRDEYEESRLVTSTHYESLSWNMIECPDLCPYSVVVFYDHDGTAAANVLSVLHRAFKALKKRQVKEGGVREP